MTDKEAAEELVRVIRSVREIKIEMVSPESIVEYMLDSIVNLSGFVANKLAPDLCPGYINYKEKQSLSVDD